MNLKFGGEKLMRRNLETRTRITFNMNTDVRVLHVSTKR